jgi:phosphomevalonate kinase
MGPERTIAAPGKAMLSGEYVVLDGVGAPALVAALDRQVLVRSRWTATPRATSSAFVETAVTMAIRWLDSVGARRPSPPERPHLELAVDSTALYAADGQKLGLGSSAACTVAAVAAVLDAWDLPLHDAATRGRLWTLADEAHASAQGSRGSGVDVAVAVHGGVLEFSRPPPSSDGTGSPIAPRCAPAEPPTGLLLRLYATGTPVATGPCVQRVRTLVATRPAEAHALLAPLVAHSHDFVAAWRAHRVDRVIHLAMELGRGLDRLGRGCDAPIVDERSRAFMGAAQELGIAVKPSGASAAELMVAFSDDPDSLEQLDRRAAALALVLLPVRVAPQGVRVVATPGGAEPKATERASVPPTPSNTATTGTS